MSIEVSILGKEDERLWDEYVLKHPDSTFFHQIGWKNVVERTYHHKPVYLLAKEDGEIRGVLPLFYMKSRIFGSKLVSVPFASYGGVCADNPEIGNALEEEVKRIAREIGVSFVELRCLQGKVIPGFISKSRYVRVVLTLPSNLDMLWAGLRKSMRRYVRVGSSNNLRVLIGSSYLNDFYNVYSYRMRELGTPVHHIEFFKELLREFSSHATIAIVRRGSDVMGGLFLLSFRNTLIYSWGGSPAEYYKFAPNYTLVWEVIKYAWAEGFKCFDFGRSLPNSGVFKFKLGWRAEAKNLHYQYYLLGYNKGVPDTSSANPRRGKFAFLWRRLPYTLTLALGPRIRCHFP